MKAKQTSIVVLALMAMMLCMCTVVLAGYKTVGAPQDFIARLDADNDGLVSQDEFDGPDEAFAQMDQNADGYLDDTEAPHGPPPGDGDFVGRLDADGDGLVSQDEFDGPDEAFTQMDQNGDGYLDDTEAPLGPPPGDHGLVAKLDTNADGLISQDEFDGPQDHFDQMDHNGDGYVDAAEAPKGPPHGGESIGRPGMGGNPPDGGNEAGRGPGHGGHGPAGGPGPGEGGNGSGNGGGQDGR